MILNNTVSEAAGDPATVIAALSVWAESTMRAAGDTRTPLIVIASSLVLNAALEDPHVWFLYVAILAILAFRPHPSTLDDGPGVGRTRWIVGAIVRMCRDRRQLRSLLLAKSAERFVALLGSGEVKL